MIVKQLFLNYFTKACHQAHKLKLPPLTLPDTSDDCIQGSLFNSAFVKQLNNIKKSHFSYP